MTDVKPTSTPIFRSIEVDKGVSITLGEPLSAEAMALCEQVGPERFQLKPGTYEGAEKIQIQLGVGAAVQEMDFWYVAGTDYKEMVENFENEIGPPTSVHDQSTVWRDPSTEFELVNGPKGLTSTLRNLAPTAEQS